MLIRFKVFFRNLAFYFFRYIYNLSNYNSDVKILPNIDFIKSNKNIVVLGNGPSLKEDLEDLSKMTEEYDFLCLNNFCSSPYYSIFKPNKYVFLDNYFFNKNVHPDWKRQREETFKIINELTTWKMQIIIPKNSNENIFEGLVSNENIEIVRVKCLGRFFKKFNSWSKFLMDCGCFGPAKNNVLIYAIYYSIWAGYKNIFIYGADMTIYKNLEVNSSNEVVMRRTYFNRDDSFEVLRVGPLKNKIPSMSSMMHSAHMMFLQHEILDSYAAYKSVNIINGSSTSQIDAYKRKLV